MHVEITSWCQRWKSISLKANKTQEKKQEKKEKNGSVFRKIKILKNLDGMGLFMNPFQAAID